MIKNFQLPTSIALIQRNKINYPLNYNCNCDSSLSSLPSKHHAFHASETRESIRTTINTVLDAYYNDISNTNDSIAKLKIIIKTVKEIFTYIHPFVDGNTRTCKLLLQKFLLENNFSPVILRNFKRFFGYSEAELLEELKIGFQNTQNLIANNFSEKLINNIYSLLSSSSTFSQLNTELHNNQQKLSLQKTILDTNNIHSSIECPNDFFDWCVKSCVSKIPQYVCYTNSFRNPKNSRYIYFFKKDDFYAKSGAYYPKLDSEIYYSGIKLHVSISVLKHINKEMRKEEICYNTKSLLQTLDKISPILAKYNRHIGQFKIVDFRYILDIYGGNAGETEKFCQNKQITIYLYLPKNQNDFNTEDIQQIAELIKEINSTLNLQEDIQPVLNIPATNIEITPNSYVSIRCDRGQWGELVESREEEACQKANELKKYLFASLKFAVNIKQNNSLLKIAILMGDIEYLISNMQKYVSNKKGDVLNNFLQILKTAEKNLKKSKSIKSINFVIDKKITNFKTILSECTANRKKTPLAVAISNEDVINIKHLLKTFPQYIDLQDKNGNTPLHLAILKKNLLISILLLARGANVDIKNLDGKTPLALAWQLNYSKIRATLQIAQDISKQPKLKNTILHIAAEKKLLWLVKACIDIGMDPNSPNTNGETPVALAAFAENPDLSLIIYFYTRGGRIKLNELQSITQDDNVDQTKTSKLPLKGKGFFHSQEQESKMKMSLIKKFLDFAPHIVKETTLFKKIPSDDYDLQSLPPKSDVHGNRIEIVKMLLDNPKLFKLILSTDGPINRKATTIYYYKSSSKLPIVTYIIEEMRYNNSSNNNLKISEFFSFFLKGAYPNLTFNCHEDKYSLTKLFLIKVKNEIKCCRFSTRNKHDIITHARPYAELLIKHGFMNEETFSSLQQSNPKVTPPLKQNAAPCSMKFHS